MTSSMMESEPVFFARIDNLGLNSLAKEFKKHGWTSMANFAFATEFQPGTGPSSELLNKAVFKKLFPNMEEGDSSKEIIAVRRLYYECYGAAGADLHRRMAPEAEQEKPRQLPKEERAARLQALKVKLGSGFDIEGETEPSDLLVDKFVTMQEKGVLRYLQWDELTKWESEVKGEPKKDPYFALAGKHLEYREAIEELTADTASDLKLLNALERRGVALELAQLMSYDVHKGIVKWFMREYNRAAAPGHAKITLLQIKNADEEIFVRLAAITRIGLQLAADGSLVLDGLVPDILKDTRVTTHLAQLQLTNPALRNFSGEPAASSGHSKAAEKRFASELANLKAENKRLRNAASGQKGKGKGKDKGKKSKGGKNYENSPMPRELWGLESKTGNGVPLCFGYNSRSGCKNAPEHGGCSRGRHLCAIKGCEGKHPAYECKK